MHGILPAPFPFAHRQIERMTNQLQLFVDRRRSGLLDPSLCLVCGQQLRRNLSPDLVPEHRQEMI